MNITKTCPKTAQMIISQYGGPDGELSASMRYLAQRYTMPVKAVGGLLTDIGTEELAHMEMICAMVYQLTRDMTIEDAKTADLTDIISIIPKACGPRLPEGFPLPPWNFSLKETRLRI